MYIVTLCLKYSRLFPCLVFFALELFFFYRDFFFFLEKEEDSDGGSTVVFLQPFSAFSGLLPRYWTSLLEHCVREVRTPSPSPTHFLLDFFFFF